MGTYVGGGGGPHVQIAVHIAPYGQTRKECAGAYGRSLKEMTSSLKGGGGGSSRG